MATGSRCGGGEKIASLWAIVPYHDPSPSKNEPRARFHTSYNALVPQVALLCRSEKDKCTACSPSNRFGLYRLRNMFLFS